MSYTLGIPGGALVQGPAIPLHVELSANVSEKAEEDNPWIPAAPFREQNRIQASAFSQAQPWLLWHLRNEPMAQEHFSCCSPFQKVFVCLFVLVIVVGVQFK